MFDHLKIKKYGIGGMANLNVNQRRRGTRRRSGYCGSDWTDRPETGTWQRPNAAYAKAAWSWRPPRRLPLFLQGIVLLSYLTTGTPPLSSTDHY